MRVLALDTTTRAGSVALLEDAHVIEERAGDAARPHGERLPGELIALLAAHDQTLASVDLFAVAAGPGSFTGLRIGIATVQGAAFVHHQPIVAVSALEALAHAVMPEAREGNLLGAWIDAHRHDVFSALYRVGGRAAPGSGRLVEVESPHVGSPAETLVRWRPLYAGGAAVAFVGDGAELYADVILHDDGLVGCEPHVRHPTPLLAAAIGRIAVARFHAGTAVQGSGVQPLYVRRPDAELARERASSGGRS